MFKLIFQDNESKTGLIVTKQLSQDDAGGHGGQGTYDPHMHLPYDPTTDRRQQKQRPDGKIKGIPTKGIPNVY